MKERDMVHPTDRELSRRSFLNGTVLAGAGVGAMGALAACAPSGAKDDLASTGVAADSVTWDKETDIVVGRFWRRRLGSRHRGAQGRCRSRHP